MIIWSFTEIMLSRGQSACIKTVIIVKIRQNAVTYFKILVNVSCDFYTWIECSDIFTWKQYWLRIVLLIFVIMNCDVFVHSLKKVISANVPLLSFTIRVSFPIKIQFINQIDEIDPSLTVSLAGTLGESENIPITL